MQKSALRQEMRRRRRALTPRQQKLAAWHLYRRVVVSSAFRYARHLAFTLANDGEIDPSLLLSEALRRGKACYLPVTAPFGAPRLRFRRWTPGAALAVNRHGIAEPRRGRTLPPRAFSLVLLPLVAFDASCNRLGMGKGYYDRSFAFRRNAKGSRPLLQGLAHECQKAERVEMEDWDVPLDGIVTDRNWYRPGKTG